MTVVPGCDAAYRGTTRSTYFRTERHVTQTEAAEMEGVGQPYISKLESGSFGSPLNHALRLLRLIGCEVVVRRRPENG